MMRSLNILVMGLCIVLIYMLSAYPVFAEDAEDWPDDSVVFEDPAALEDTSDFDDQSLIEDMSMDEGDNTDVGNVADTSSDEIIEKIDSQGQALEVLNDSVSTLNSKVDLLVAENETTSNSGDDVSEGGTASGSVEASEASATDIYNAVVFSVQSLWLLTGFVTAFLLCRFFLI